ncbi:MAG: BMC domain-containing protein [Candidatus Rokubacteria bacterium]|nr:BMC domain-containing protein [Candidatus Rokubacteria bacterium]
MMNGSLGLVETRGFVGLARVVDTMVKTAPVKVGRYHKIGGGFVMVCVEGPLSAVKYAADAAFQVAPEKHIAVAVLPAPSRAVLALLGLHSRPEIGEGLARIGPSASMGFLETRGLLPLALALDAMMKSVAVVFVGHELVGDGLVTACVVGDIASVQHAIDVGAHEASRVGEMVGAHLVTNPQMDFAQAFSEITRVKPSEGELTERSLFSDQQGQWGS